MLAGMWTLTKPKMPGPGEALPGRAEKMPVPAKHFVNGARLQPPFPAGTELATFGLGCFWGAEKKFWEQPGVTSTAVGYAGGTTPNPTYREVCSGLTGHTEVVQVVFDPKVVSYGELLRIFWEAHDPTQGMQQGNDVGTQYRSAIYTHGDAQRAEAIASRDAYARALADAGSRRDHDRDRARARVLLRRGLPPAVPGEEPRRLLRPRRHRRVVPDRRRRRRAALSLPAAPRTSGLRYADKRNRQEGEARPARRKTPVAPRRASSCARRSSTCARASTARARASRRSRSDCRRRAARACR